MVHIDIDPFKKIRKNAHIWRGEKTIIWYQEQLDDSFSIVALYDFGDKKRRLFLAVDNNKQKVEFKNDEITSKQYQEIKNEIELIDKMLAQQ